MFKRLFAALRRKHGGNVASPKDAGNVSVSKEEFTPLKFEKTDEKVELAKEPVAEVQETSVATGVSQKEVQSASVAIRPDFKFSSVITPNNSFEKYTLHAYDLNYALYTEASDKPEEFVKDVEDKVHELYDVHCAFDRLFNVMKNHNTQVSIDESDAMSMYVVAALQCRNGKCYAQALDKLKEGISGEGYFSNSVCSVAVSILCASGDLSDAYLLLQYLVLYCPEEISAIFFRRYAQLIMSVEELAKTDIEDLVVSYMQNSSQKSFFIKNTYVPIINVPIGAGIFKSDVEYLKSAAPEEYEHYAIDAEKKCNESSERVFETLLDKLHGGTDAEGVWENDRKQDEQKAILQKKEFRFSDVITPENDFEAYTLHAFDVNYAQFANLSDEPEKSIDAIKHQLHELSNIHCLFDKIFDEIIKPDVTIIEDTSMTKKSIMTMAENLCQQRAHTCIYTSDSLMWRIKETFMLIKLIVEQRKNITPDACTIVISLLYLVGDLSDAYLMLKYLAFYPSEEVQNNFLPGYVPLIASVEEITAKSLEEFIHTYIGVYIEGTKTKIVNIPVKSGIFKKDIEEIKYDKPEYYKRFLYNSEECNETTETIFETLSDRLHREVEVEEEKKNVETKTNKEEKLIKKDIDFESILDKTQYDVVKTTSGYVRVLGCAGSGKTYILQKRFLYLVNELDIDPNRILLICSTKRAAVAMKEEIREIIGATPRFVMTFSEIGNYIVRNEITSIGWTENYRIVNFYDRKQIGERITINHAMWENIEQCLNEIKREKQDSTKTYDYVEDLLHGYPHPTFNNLSEYTQMQYVLETFDLTDLICVPLFLFDRENTVREKYINMFDYVMVDDFQDVTEAEYDLTLALAAKTNNLLITGDPNQFLFSWEGAKKNLLMNFEKFYDCETFYLEGSYRCNEAIMNLAQKTLKIFPDFNIKNVSRIGQNEGVVKIRGMADDREGVALLIRDIKKEHDSEINPVAYSDMAVVFNYESDAGKVYLQFKRNSIPYQYMLKPSYKQSHGYSLIMSCVRSSIYDNLFDYINIMDYSIVSKEMYDKLVPRRGDEDWSLYENAKNDPEAFIKEQFLNPLKKEHDPYHFNDKKISVLERKLQMIKDLKKAAQLPTIKDFSEKMRILLDENELLKYDEERKAFAEIENYLNLHSNEEVSSCLKKIIDEAMLANEYDKEFDAEGIKILSPRDMRSEQFKAIFCYKMYYDEEAQTYDRYYESKLTNPNIRFYSVATKTAKSIYLYTKE